MIEFGENYNEDTKVNMRDKYLDTFKSYCKGNLDRHIMNIDHLLENGVGVADHPDFIGTMIKEMENVAKFDELLTMADKYFLMKNNVFNG